MEKTSWKLKTWHVLRSLLLAYAVTVILLLLLALLLYKLELDEGKISIGIIAVYVLSCFVGGLAAGKASQSRKFIWGLLVGALYFLVLAVVSIASGQGGAPILQMATTGALCAGGGMLGGMLA